METQSYYVNVIKEDLSQRQRANPHYSLRAYSRDLGIHSSTLSQILKGKRKLPLKNAEQVIAKLELRPKERTLFMESLFRSGVSIDKIKIEDLDRRFMLDESYHKVIAQWEHYAVLELFDVCGFEASVAEVSRRLGVNENRAEVVLNNLVSCGLLHHSEDGSLQKTHADVRTTEDVTSQALKESHLEALEMGKQKLREIEVELRDFSSTTLAIDLDKLPEAKTIIREFRQKMSALLKDGNKTDVYQLAVQFYPLTEVKNKKLN